MISKNDLPKRYYSTGEVAELLGVVPMTVIRWDKVGKIKFSRTDTNRRVISKEDLIDFLKEQKMYVDLPDKNKMDIVYARVSTKKQVDDGDLDRQVLSIIEQVQDLSNPLILKEQGSGLNAKRKKLGKLLELVMDDKVNRIFVTYKERLSRFGYELIETICKKHDVDIIILNETQEKPLEQELAEDMMMLLASFSGKLYGSRIHKNKIIIEEKGGDDGSISTQDSDISDG